MDNEVEVQVVMDNHQKTPFKYMNDLRYNTLEIFFSL